MESKFQLLRRAAADKNGATLTAVGFDILWPSCQFHGDSPSRADLQKICQLIESAEMRSAVAGRQAGIRADR